MKLRGFTLIELLIVVAIIAILAAIAIPNFLQAQVRSKLSRAYADMASLATTLESYYVDNNKYPPDSGGGRGWKTDINGHAGFWTLALVTTPIAYITSLPPDPFMPSDYPDKWRLNGYRSYHYGHNTAFPPGSQFQWFLASLGPDMSWAVGGVNGVYDPTNGTVSYGVIYIWGPGNVRKTGW